MPGPLASTRCQVCGFTQAHLRRPENHVRAYKSKKAPPKRDTGLRRCVYTNPHEHTTTNIGSCPSDENERNTHTHLRSPEKLVRTCRYGNIASCRKWRENTSNEKQKKSNTHTDTHTDTHIRTQTHTDAHRRTQTHTDRSL